MGVAESNSDVIIFTGSSEIAVSVHVQLDFGHMANRHNIHSLPGTKSGSSSPKEVAEVLNLYSRLMHYGPRR